MDRERASGERGTGERERQRGMVVRPVPGPKWVFVLEKGTL